MTTKTKTTLPVRSREAKAGWWTVRLGDVADVQWGDTNTTKAAYKPTGYLAFSATGPDGFMDHYDFNRDGVVLSAIGANCGYTWFASGKWSCIKNTIRFWGIDGKADSLFLYYKTRNKNLWPQRGSAQPFISQTDARTLELEIPADIDKQKRIAEILSAFDEKIENNNCIIKALEEMAQAIFKEWFVRNTKGKNQNVKLFEIANITMGQSPQSQHYNVRGDGTPFHQGVTNFGDRFPTHKIFSIVGEKEAEMGDILISVRAPVGRVNIANAKIVLGRGLAAIRHKQNTQSFLFYLLKHTFVKEDSIGSGSVFPAVTKRELEGLLVNMLDEGTIGRFEKVVLPMDGHIQELTNENQKLAAMRDLLLPRLMSGEIRV